MKAKVEFFLAEIFKRPTDAEKVNLIIGISNFCDFGMGPKRLRMILSQDNTGCTAAMKAMKT